MTQNGFLFDWMVWQNISKNYSDLRAIEHLDIYPKIKDLLHRRAGRLGSNLSGGEKQVILLLRAYIQKDTFMVILDEPTSNVDPFNKIIIYDIIRELCRRKTVICISHDESLKPYFNRIHHLQDGVLVSKN